MAIDLTDITDEVARAWWADYYPGDEIDDNGLFALRGALLPTINRTAEAVEAQVRREIRVKIDTLPFADFDHYTILKDLALHAVG